MLEVSLLGQFDVREDGRHLDIPTRNAQALLAYLLLTAGQVHRREKLAGLLWPDSAEENARSNLRHELWRLRKALPETVPPFILSDDLTIAFNRESQFTLDALTLESAPVEGSATAELIEAVSAYGGELLPGFYQEWVFVERDRLQAAFEARMTRLLEMLQAEERWSEVGEWATRWITAAEWPESAYRALMSAYASQGDAPRAIQAYERLHKGLADDLGLEPSAPTIALAGQIRNGWRPPAAAVAQSRPQVSLPHGDRSNLPRPLTSFVGRKKEIVQVKELVGDARLVTIVGPGGVGKSRLGIEATRQLTNRYPDGVWWAELAPITAGFVSVEELVLQAVARAVQLPESSGDSVRADLREYLRQRTLLLVLDNCEHLIAACAAIVESLLTQQEGLSILATSREPLRIPGERIWELPSLSVPEASGLESDEQILEAEAVQLMLQRAQTSRTGYAPGAVDLQAMARICRQLDGLPLAIELAAARISLLSMAQIADRLDNRFSLLTEGQRTALPRQQTLRATIEWSYDLLEEPEQALFTRLSVFAGSFALEPIEAICSGPDVPADEVLGLLGHLRDKSLLQIDPASQTALGGTRYRLLDSIRAFGRLKLDEAAETRTTHDRHAAYYRDLLELAEPELWLDTAWPHWTRLLDVEYDNIRSAIDWSIYSDQAEIGLRIVTVLTWFWFGFHSMRESVELAQTILALPSAAAPTIYRARLLNTISYLQCLLGEMTTVRAQMEEALAILSENESESLVGRAWALQLEAQVLSYEGLPEAADRAMQEGVELSRTLNDRTSSSLGLALWGDIVLKTGDIPRAIQVYEGRADILRTTNNNFAAYPLRRLGYLAMEREEYHVAWRYFRESLQINVESGDRRGRIANLVSLASLALRTGQTAVAARLLGNIERHMEALANLIALDQEQLELVRWQLRKVMGQDALSAKLDEGREISEEQLLALIESNFAEEPVLPGANNT